MLEFHEHADAELAQIDRFGHAGRSARAATWSGEKDVVTVVIGVHLLCARPTRPTSLPAESGGRDKAENVSRGRTAGRTPA